MKQTVNRNIQVVTAIVMAFVLVAPNLSYAIESDASNTTTVTSEQSEHVSTPSDEVSAPADPAPEQVAPSGPVSSGASTSQGGTVGGEIPSDFCIQADINNNKVIDQNDEDIISAHMDEQGTIHATGDVDQNGRTDFDDIAIYDHAYWHCNGVEGIPVSCGIADLNKDGVINAADYIIIDQAYNNAGPYDQAHGDINGDGVIDFDDYVLMDFAHNTCPHPVTDNGNNNNNGNNNGNNNSGGGSSSSGGSSVIPFGQVLGAFTGPSCESYLNSFIKLGAQNDIGDVARLQIFLNNEMGAKLTLNGMYDIATVNILNMFQLKYFKDILTPWVAHGLPDEKTSTGFVFKTTRHKINSIMCPTLNAPAPILP